MSNPPVASPAGPVLLETIENGVALLVMNRPDKLNSLNNELATALNQTFERIGKKRKWSLPFALTASISSRQYKSFWVRAPKRYVT